MAKDPAFLFYPNDWTGGTQWMTLEEKGAYIELLVLQWQCHRITTDKAKRVLGTDYSKLWPVLEEKFTQDENGDWYNERLDLEMAKRRAHGEKQRENISKRWTKTDTNEDTKPIPNGYDGITMVIPLGNGNGNGNGNEDVNKKKGDARGKKKPDPVTLPWNTPEFIQTWDSWKRYKADQFSFRYKPTGEQAALMELNKLAGGSMAAAREIIHQSMGNGWKGFFELKSNGNGKQITNHQERRVAVNEAFNDFWAAKNALSANEDPGNTGTPG